MGKRNRSNIFWDYFVVSESFLFLSLESELSFDSEDSEINFDRACSATVNSLLRALRAICNILSHDGENLFADELTS